MRPARREDCPGILAIYNHAVLHTAASYDEEPRTLEDRERWLAEHQREGYPVLVATEADKLLGWGALHPFGTRSGFRFTVEDSVYVAQEARGHGIGSRLLSTLVAAAVERGSHAIIAAIDAENIPSIRLHGRCGFVEVGRFREVGFKFGRWRDVVYLERLLA